MIPTLPPNPAALEESLSLSEEILADIELSRVPLSNIALKTSRLARLINDSDMEQIMLLESGGYPIDQGIMTPLSWRLSGIAGRQYSMDNEETGKTKQYAYIESIEQLEEQIQIAKRGLDAAHDPDISITSANPSQYVFSPSGNYQERLNLRNQAQTASRRLASRRSFIHEFVSRVHYELKFSGVASEIFSRIRSRVDRSIAILVPDAVRRFAAVYENLRSENPEDWSNAAHSCRRILIDLADSVFPAQEDRVIDVDGDEQIIKLGPGNYINRIICYVDDNSDSQVASSIIGSHLRFIGDRLDTIASGTQKGTHSDILSREEADRIVVNTYLLVGDVLSLMRTSDDRNSATPEE